MKRKINKVGTGTLTLSLPAKWIKTHNLKSGDELEVMESKDSLIVSTSEIRPPSKRIAFNFTELNRWKIRKILFGAYKNGFEEIEINFKDPNILAVINNESEMLLGFEIITQRKDFCLLKNVASPLKESFPDLVNKTFLFTLSYLEDIFTAFETKDFKSLEDLELRERNQNKLILALLRLLLEYRYIITPNPEFIYFIISEIEAIGDNFKHICRVYKNKEIVLGTDVRNFFRETLNLFRTTYKLYYKFDLQKHVQLAKENIKMANNHLIEACSNDEKILVCNLDTIITRLYDILREIFHRDIEQCPGYVKLEQDNT